MTNFNEDRTVAFNDHGADRGHAGPKAGLVEAPRARLVCTDPSQVESTLPGGGIINLVPGTEQTVGRGETCTYPIGSRKLSRQHARIFVGMGAWGVEDLNSTNGVRVNDEKVQTAWLKQGDEVRFGPIPFRFEIERPDSLRPIPLPSSSDGGEGEHTMIFGGDSGVQAAAAMIKAVRESEQIEDEQPQVVVPTAPPKKAAAVAAPTKGSGAWILPTAIATAVVMVIGGVIYLYPSFMRSQKIAAITTPDTAIVTRVIDRARETAGIPTDTSRLDDINLLQPVIRDTENAIDGEYADSRELANLYARSRFLVFEREFLPLFTHPDATGEALKEAGRKAYELRSRLDKVSHTLAPLPIGIDQDPLKAAADLADLARILVDYRSFSRQFPVVGKTASQPTLPQIKAVEARKDELIKYRHLYNEVLGSDYRLFNAQVQDVENNDMGLLGRWHDFLVSGQ